MTAIREIDTKIHLPTDGDGTLKQTVADRYGNQIYLTDERWTHIVNTHSEMDSHRNNLLLTLQTGRRKQEPLDPSKYKYYKRFDILETGYNHIIVVVKFSEKVEKDTKKRIPNNFVLTAYQTFIFSR